MSIKDVYVWKTIKFKDMEYFMNFYDENQIFQLEQCP